MKPLTLASEAIDFAIDNEQASINFYWQIAGRAPNTVARRIFESLAGEEKRHKAKLLGIRKRTRFPQFKKQRINLRLADYLVAPDPEEVADYPDALVIAIKKENAAYNLYSDLAAQVDDDNASRVFQYLARQEAKHQRRFEKEFNRVVPKKKMIRYKTN